MNQWPEKLVLTISASDLDYKRLDVYLVEKIPNISRSLVKKFFEDGFIQSETKLELKKMPAVGSIIYVKIPEAKNTDLISQEIPLDILYEDEHLLVLNKHAGLVTHPAPGNEDGTLVNAILHHCGDSLKGVGGEKRPGIVHRLDKGTTGVMVVAKTHQCHEGLVELFSKHDIERKYWALAQGKEPLKAGRIETMIGRHPQHRQKMSTKAGGHTKKAITDYKVLETFVKKIVHLELTLHTGRTHQIRVHLSEILHCPILGDDLYGNTGNQVNQSPEDIRSILKAYPYPLLHAKVLGFVHPMTKEKLYFEAPPNETFQTILKTLKEIS